VATDSLDAASAEADAENLEDVGKIRTTGRVEYKSLAEVPEEKGEGKVKDKRDEVCQPPANVLFAVGSGDTHETTNVDQKIEPEHDTLSGSLGVDNDSLALLGRDNDRDRLGHLVEKEGRNIGLEDTCRCRSASTSALLLHALLYIL